jgi:predicted helicase
VDHFFGGGPTVGRKDKVFAHLINETNIGIDKRVFMTATERFYRGSSDQIVSMDDPEIYGDTFELLTFKQAIESDNIICDYRFVTIGIAQSEITQLWEDNSYLRIEGTELDEDTTRSLASGLALRKAYSQFGVKRAISFHRSIKLASAFKNQQEKFSEAFPELAEVDCFHVSSKTSTGDRAVQLREFGAAKRGLITNARCLTEGVDIPSVDCVLFADPRQSKVDIVQAAGRALRKAEGKKFGYVIVPLVVPDDVDLETFASSTGFAQVVTTIKALASEDERIVEHLRVISTGKTASTGSQITAELTEVLAEKVDAAIFLENLKLKVWDKVAKLYWRSFEEARNFVQSLKLKSREEWDAYTKSGKLPKDIPVAVQMIFKDKGWSGYGDWLGTGRIANRSKRFRGFETARRFVQSQNLKSNKEWRAFCTSGHLPEDIPSNPDKGYYDNGWMDWGDWLGTGKVASSAIEYRTFA